MRSRREGKRVVWKNTGGVLEKVVVKQESEEEELSDSSHAVTPKRVLRGKTEKVKTPEKAKGKALVKKGKRKQVQVSEEECVESDTDNQEVTKKPRRSDSKEKSKAAQKQEELSKADDDEYLEADDQEMFDDDVQETQEDSESKKEPEVVPQEAMVVVDRLPQETIENKAEKVVLDLTQTKLIPVMMMQRDVVVKSQTEEESGDTIVVAEIDPISLEEVRTLDPSSQEAAQILMIQEEVGTEEQDVPVKGKGKKRRLAQRADCDLCGQEFLAENLERHKRYTCKENPNKVPLYNCELCTFNTEDLDQMPDHMKVHPEGFKPTKGRTTVCEVCSAEFDTVKSKQYHEWKVHEYFGSRVSYSCEYCGKRFPTKWQYDQHVGYHIGKISF